MGRSIERKVHKTVLPRNCLNWSDLSLWVICRTCPENGVYERRWVRCFKRSRSQTREIKSYPAIPRSTNHLRFDFSGCLFYLYSVGITDCIISWGRSSAGRALEWHSRGRRFDPDRLHQTNQKSPARFFSFRRIARGNIPLSPAPDHFFCMASGSLGNLDAAQHARYLFDSFAFFELVNRR